MTNETKIIAFHLPQFHSFPENDEWWGNGFTEWTNVRKAKPLFAGHNQPRIPLNDNYYNMLDYKTRKWQAELAKKYGIDGFCYYHYWFNGKLLMEKPLESLLLEKDIDISFCLCWANEPWTRAWDGKASAVLMPQHYGDEPEWEKHLNYLMQFFKDERYIKIDNAPMYILYRSNSIPRCNEMVKYWEKLCKEQGFSGIHIVEELNGFQNKPVCNDSKAVLEFQPTCAEKQKGRFRWQIDKLKSWMHTKTKGYTSGVYTIDFESVWKRIINMPVPGYAGKKAYLGGFVGWDNSPRKRKAGIFTGNTPEIFRKYLTLLLKKAKANDSEYIFLNAWNEWGEGAYLEPDTTNKYAYLEAVIKSK